MVGVRSGGCGAGLGLINRSGSSATSSRLGLNGGVMAWIAESSGVVRACPKYDEPSWIPGKVPVEPSANESQIPDSRLDFGDRGVVDPSVPPMVSGPCCMGTRGKREENRGGPTMDCE